MFLGAIGYSGGGSYDARRELVQWLARRVDVSSLRPDLCAYNPRIAQSAAFVFVSASNRRAASCDRSRDRPAMSRAATGRHDLTTSGHRSLVCSSLTIAAPIARPTFM